MKLWRRTCQFPRAQKANCVSTFGKDNHLNSCEGVLFLMTHHFMLHINDLFVYSIQLSNDNHLPPCDSNFGRLNTWYFFILKEKKKIQI